MSTITHTQVYLAGKLFIRGVIEVQTGLRIGGSKEGFEIGGVDLVVIKTPGGTPYIPGSSLKGKLRSLLGWKHGSIDVSTDKPEIKKLFGDAGEKRDHNEGNPSRVLVRDAFLDEAQFATDFSAEKVSLDTPYTEVKTENRIQRVAGKAEHPRQLERVPAGARFNFEIVLNLVSNTPAPEGEIWDSGENQQMHQLLTAAMRLLQDDYLGGQGSRGYGKILFKNLNYTWRSMADYTAPEAPARTLPNLFAPTT